MYEGLLSLAIGKRLNQKFPFNKFQPRRWHNGLKLWSRKRKVWRWNPSRDRTVSDISTAELSVIVVSKTKPRRWPLLTDFPLSRVHKVWHTSADHKSNFASLHW